MKPWHKSRTSAGPQPLSWEPLSYNTSLWFVSFRRHIYLNRVKLFCVSQKRACWNDFILLSLSLCGFLSLVCILSCCIFKLMFHICVIYPPPRLQRGLTPAGSSRPLKSINFNPGPVWWCRKVQCVRACVCVCVFVWHSFLWLQQRCVSLKSRLLLRPLPLYHHRGFKQRRYTLGVWGGREIALVAGQL